MEIGTAVLRRYSLFGGLMDADLSQVRSMMVVEEVAVGTVIVREGERGDRIYFIAAGAVSVRKHRQGANAGSAEAIEVELAKLVTGEAFGEMELVDLQPRSSTVVAIEPCTLLTIAAKDLLRLQRERPQALTLLVMNLARDLSRRLRKADDRIAAGG